MTSTFWNIILARPFLRLLHRSLSGRLSQVATIPVEHPSLQVIEFSAFLHLRSVLASCGFDFFPRWVFKTAVATASSAADPQVSSQSLIHKRQERRPKTGSMVRSSKERMQTKGLGHSWNLLQSCKWVPGSLAVTGKNGAHRLGRTHALVPSCATEESTMTWNDRVSELTTESMVTTTETHDVPRPTGEVHEPPAFVDINVSSVFAEETHHRTNESRI